MVNIDEIASQIEWNKKQTYYGGKNGFDYCCMKDGKVKCSGSRREMLEVALKNKGYYVAIIVPVSFTENGE